MENSAKQQIVERLKQATNILVTVRTDPTIDLLSACIGLSLLLDKMDKHAAAVFSGKVPSAMEFLKPEDTIEPTPNSLRDFIIALDKAKADKLRYKVEDKLVRIFITPYKASITKDDLEFSQGDFNIDVLVALGVHAQAELDAAITAHGRILHDAVVISINNTPNGNLGSLNWQEISASSVAEMITSLAPDLGENLLDEQIATALLTGIVAETARFSNDKTTPQTMRLAGELMAAGANQQLVATELHNEIPVPTMPITDAATAPAAPVEKKDSGTVHIEHPEEQVSEPEVKPASTDVVLTAAQPEVPSSVSDVPAATSVAAQSPEPTPISITPGRDMLPTPPADSTALDTIPGLPLNNELFTGAFTDDAVPQRSTSYLVDGQTPAAAPSTPAVMPPSQAAPATPNPFARPWSPNQIASPTPPASTQPAVPAPAIAPFAPAAAQPATTRPSVWPAQPLRPASSFSPPATPSMTLPPAQPTPVASTSTVAPQTLADLEVSLHSPHATTPTQPDAPSVVPLTPPVAPPASVPVPQGPDEDSIARAREEVLKALSESSEPLSPPVAFNAQPLGDRLHTDNAPADSSAIQINADGTVKPDSAATPQSPPPGPPPLQF